MKSNSLSLLRKIMPGQSTSSDHEMDSYKLDFLIHHIYIKHAHYSGSVIDIC